MKVYDNKDVYKVAVVGDQHLRSTNPRSRKDSYFDAILEKMDWIFENNDIFIGLGDLFHKPTIGQEHLYKLLRMLDARKRQGKKFYTIYGNHDLIKYQQEDIYRTSLGIVYLSRLGKHLESIYVNCAYFKAIPFDIKVVIPEPTHRQNTILLGHYFFEFERDPLYSMTRDHIANTQADIVMLGHDHEPYPERQFGRTKLLRGGSLCRNTKHKFHTTRLPQYYQFTIGKEDYSYELVEVSVAKPPIEVFYKEALERKDIKKEYTSFVADIQTLLSEFKRFEDDDTACISKGLQELEAPEHIEPYIKEIYELLGIDYY